MSRRNGPMSQCDRCGVSAEARALIELHDEYQFNDIRWVCRSCEALVTKAIRRVLADLQDRKIAAARAAILGEGE